MRFESFWRGFDPSNHWFFRQIRDKEGVCYSVMGDVPSSGSPKVFYSAEVRVCNDDRIEGADFSASFHDRDAGSHLRLPNYVCIHGPDFVREKVQDRQDKPAGADAACMVVSNQNAEKRKDLVRALWDAGLRVDCGGDVLNNCDGPAKGSTPAERDRNFVDFAKHYKFVIAGENQRKPGYTTEKLFNAFRAGAIPIYWGNPDVGDFFNRGALVHCDDFRSFEDVARHVKKLIASESKFEEVRNRTALPQNDIYSTEKIKHFIYRI